MGQFSRNLSSLQRQNSGYPQGYGMQRPVSARPLQQRQVQMHRQQRPVSPSLAPMSAARRSAQQQRRQEVLMGLVAAAVLTFLGAISVGGVVVVVHAIVDVALVAYIFALASLAQRGKARSNVTTLYPSGAVQPQMVQAYSQRQRVAR